MRLCGISSHFWLLSPCTGQVTHALLTRPPLSHRSRHSEEIQDKRFVRLACVRHAASVHPEPGSNSQIKLSRHSSNARASTALDSLFRANKIRCLPSLKNHWSLNCTLLLFRFELRSLPWTPLADITRFRIRILN